MSRYEEIMNGAAANEYGLGILGIDADEQKKMNLVNLVAEQLAYLTEAILQNLDNHAEELPDPDMKENFIQGLNKMEMHQFSSIPIETRIQNTLQFLQESVGEIYGVDFGIDTDFSARNFNGIAMLFEEEGENDVFTIPVDEADVMELDIFLDERLDAMKREREETKKLDLTEH